MTYELSAIDRRFADFICRQSGDTSRTLYLVVSLVSSAVGRGHICVHLPSLAGSRIVVDGADSGLSRNGRRTRTLAAKREKRSSQKYFFSRKNGGKFTLSFIFFLLSPGTCHGPGPKGR